MDLNEAFQRGHGVVRYSQIIESGITQSKFRRHVRDGLLRRVRHGWYASHLADADVVAAVSRGGVLSCVSALAKYGIWIPPRLNDRPHMRCTPERLNNGRPTGFCMPYGRAESAVWAVDELPAAVRHALRCLDHEALVVVCDSILNLGLLDHDDLLREAESAPQSVRRLLQRCDRAESGIETMTRLRLARRRIKAVPQVEITGVGRVDFLIGDRLIVEVDGAEFHRDRFEQDHARDLVAKRVGYEVVRFTYRQVIGQWPECEATIVAMVRRGMHKGPLYPEALDLKDFLTAA